MATLRSVTDILGEFYQEHRNDPEWQEFFSFHDVAMPLAWLSWQGYANPTESATQYIEETWTVFCQLFEIDYANTFLNLEEFMTFAVWAKENSIPS